MTHHTVAIIGGGQAGLSVSHLLGQSGIDHVVFEKNRIGHAWAKERWDSFCLVTPNWQCRLPGYRYAGDDPHGFMLRDDIVAFIADYAALVRPPIREGVTVTRVSQRAHGAFTLETSMGDVTADHVIVAISGYHVPTKPAAASGLRAGLTEIHSHEYRNPDRLPPGGILVVGTGQSGCQIAEDLQRAGREVHLAVGATPRSPRRYRGRDVTEWLTANGHYDMPIDDHPKGYAVRANENHYLSGRDGGKEIDLRQFAKDGMKLYGRIDAMAGARVTFQPNLRRNLDAADAAYLKIRATIDAYIDAAGIDAPPAPLYEPCWQPDQEPSQLDLDRAGIGAIIWGTGFRQDFRFIDLPAFDAAGYPHHRRGVSTACPGLYFLGLPWLYTWGSGRFAGIERDATHVAEHVRMMAGRASQRRMTASLL